MTIWIKDVVIAVLIEQLLIEASLTNMNTNICRKSRSRGIHAW